VGSFIPLYYFLVVYNLLEGGGGGAGQGRAVYQLMIGFSDLFDTYPLSSP
jgi:hypothetical protein